MCDEGRAEQIDFGVSWQNVTFTTTEKWSGSVGILVSASPYASIDSIIAMFFVLVPGDGGVVSLLRPLLAC